LFLIWEYKKPQKIQCSQRFLPNPHKHWIFLNSGADALIGELRSQASACFTRIPPTFGGSLLMKISGLDGSRTRVQKPIPCPSTSVVYYLTFPPPHENKHPCGFSSFMIRPQVQSLACVVSHIVEAWVLKC